MPRFNYTGIDGAGKTAKGSVTAESPFAARKQLRARNIHPSSVEQAALGQEPKALLMSILGRGGKAQILDFTRQFATLLQAEIKLTEALSVLIQQTSSMQFRGVLTDIRDRVVTGESFTDAMGDYSDYFDILYISMVRVGEVTGSLPHSLSTIAKFMEKRQRVQSKITTVMVYPVILFVVCIVAVLILTTTVIPKITEQITKTGQELPLITKLLMGFSNTLKHWWFVVLGAAVAAAWAIKRAVATEKGHYLRDKFLLSLPVFGPLIKQRVVARFASTLSTLLGSGLTMAESLRVVAEVTGNSIMNRAVKQARERILTGADIATPLRESGVIDPAIAHMVTVGEKSGELGSMLANISENLEASTDVVIERLSAALEPIIIVLMAVLIGVIAYATLLPIIRFSATQF
jgi:type II secretory pathway component PulF